MMKGFFTTKAIKVGGILLLALFLIASAVAFLKTGTGSVSERQSTTRQPVVSRPVSSESPNILFILTDDQDLASLAYMPKLQKYLVNEGTSFSNYFDNYALCCVARASILRGQNANNTHVKGNQLPNGGFEKFQQLGVNGEQETIGVWLKNWGYTTSFIGKYLNGYGKGEDKATSKNHVPPGWDDWRAIFTQEVYDYEMNENGKVVTYGKAPEDFKTDVLADKTVSFLEKRTNADSPFFMYLAPTAPHAPATPAPRHAGMFADLQVPRTAAFDEADVSDKALWVREQGPLSSKKIAELDEKYRKRLGSLQAVDDMIERIIQTLEKTGELDNTYIVFTSDNGFHLGQHRLDAGKQTIYEEDIHLPLIVRGPGVAKGEVVDDIVGNVDLAPTFAELAGGAPMSVDSDGRSFAGLLSESFPAPSAPRNGYLIGFGVDDFISKAPKPSKGDKTKTKTNDNDTLNEDGDFLLGANALKKGYIGVRTRNYMYAEFLNGDKELYDLRKDPMELSNMYRSANPDLIASIQAMLAKLRTCAGESCRQAEQMPIKE